MLHSLIRLVLVVTCIAGSALPALAQSGGTGLKVADYKTISYVIEPLSDDAAEIGLTNNRLQTRLELRLRQTGLVPVTAAGEPTFLYINVNVVGGAFPIELSFNRTVSFSDAGREYIVQFARVWQTSSAGTHSGHPEYIVIGVDQRLDRFLNEYLRVNQG